MVLDRKVCHGHWPADDRYTFSGQLVKSLGHIAFYAKTMSAHITGKVPE